MSKKFTDRTELILGEDGIEKLKNSHVLLIGVGGVGSFCAEALIRAGLGNITIVDYSEVEITDFNRQLPGINSNLGKDKVEVVKERLLEDIEEKPSRADSDFNSEKEMQQNAFERLGKDVVIIETLSIMNIIFAISTISLVVALIFTNKNK